MERGERHVLFHNHPAKSVAYCVGLICNLEGRGGQVGGGTSQLGEEMLYRTGP